MLLDDEDEADNELRVPLRPSTLTNTTRLRLMSKLSTMPCVDLCLHENKENILCICLYVVRQIDVAVVYLAVCSFLEHKRLDGVEHELLDDLDDRLKC